MGKKIQIIFILLFLFALVGCKQVPEAEHGAIYGSVLLNNQVDHSGVVVTARSEQTTGKTITEESGMYVINGLQNGSYEVTVSKNGWYVPEEESPTKTVAVTEGESIMNVDFVMDSDSMPPAPPE